jgi:uncharacterized protein
MAMTMIGEQKISAPKQTVWEKLNDPEVLQSCVPGCETLEVVGKNEFRAIATNKVGPVKVRFVGKVKLADIEPPHSYKILGEGEGGLAGFAKGSAEVTLVAIDEGTLLRYTVDAQIGGKLAQLGQRLINGAAKKMADEFFIRFSKSIR